MWLLLAVSRECVVGNVELPDRIRTGLLDRKAYFALISRAALGEEVAAY